MRVAGRDEIVAYANALLEVERWPEFAPPGLQVVGGGRGDAARSVASRARARCSSTRPTSGPTWCSSTTGSSGATSRSSSTSGSEAGSRRSSTRTRRSSPTTLPSTRTTTLGNAAQLAATDRGDAGGPVRQRRARAARSTGSRSPSWRHGVARRSRPSGSRSSSRTARTRIERLAVSTGAAGYDLIRAAHEGFDALLTGEPEEPNLATAQELGIHLIAAGHHATERFGVQALAAHLAERFAIEWRYHRGRQPGLGSAPSVLADVP